MRSPLHTPQKAAGLYQQGWFLTGHYEASNHHGKAVVLETTKQLAAGETVDLTADIKPNYDFFKGGTGYAAKDSDTGS